MHTAALADMGEDVEGVVCGWCVGGVWVVCDELCVGGVFSQKRLQRFFLKFDKICRIMDSSYV